MQKRGKRLVTELKTIVLDLMNSIADCKPDGPGCSYKEIQDLAGLDLNLDAQDGWLTWSILASLSQEHKVQSVRRGRRLYWKLI